MADDLFHLFTVSSQQDKPFILVGAELGALVAQFYTNIYERFVTFTFVVSFILGARCSSVVRAFAHSAMGRRIDPSWGGPIELFLVPASAPRLV